MAWREKDCFGRTSSTVDMIVMDPESGTMIQELDPSLSKLSHMRAKFDSLINDFVLH